MRIPDSTRKYLRLSLQTLLFCLLISSTPAANTQARDINAFGSAFFSEIDLDHNEMATVKPLVQSGDYEAALDEWRNVVIDRLRPVEWTEHYQHSYQTHPMKKNIPQFLVGYMSESTYTNSLTGFYDIYGMRGAPGTTGPIDWLALPPDPQPPGYEGVSVYYNSFDFSTAFDTIYFQTEDQIYLLKWFQIASDFARNQKLAIEALSEAEQDNYNCNWSTDAGPVLGQAGRTKRLVRMLACFAKCLPNGGKPARWLDTLHPVTNNLASSSYELIPSEELADIALSLVKDHPEALISAYRNPAKLPNQRASGLAALLFITKAFSEFIDSPYIYDQASGGLLDFTPQNFLNDGGMLEQSMNYNAGDADNFYALEPIFASINGPTWLTALLDATDHFNRLKACLRTPLGGEPQIGNGNAVIAPGVWENQQTWNDWLAEQTAEIPADPVGLQIYSNLLDQGNADLPAFDSIAFPYSGYYVQRNGWKMDDLQLFFKCSRFQNGHRMLDRNAIQITAYGRQMLIAAGPPDYFDSLPDGLQDYLQESTHSYKINTVLVDGLSQQVTPIEEIAPSTPLNNRFHTSEFFGFVDGEHNTGYGTSDYNYNGPKIKDIRHQRHVWMLRKIGVWIVTDIMINEGTEGHTYTQTWNFPPEYYDQIRPDRDPVRGYTEEQVVPDINAKRIYTTDDGPNVELRHSGSDSLNYTKFFGDTDPYRGWFARFIADAIPKVDVHASWTVAGPDTDAMITLIQPSPAGEASPLSSYTDLSSGTTHGFSASTPMGTNVYYLYKPYGGLLNAGDVQASAESILVTDNGAGTIHGTAIGCGYVKIGSYAPVKPAFADFEFIVDGNSLLLQEIRCPDMFTWETDGNEIAPRYSETTLSNAVMTLSYPASGDIEPPQAPLHLVSPRQDPTRIWMEWTPVPDADKCLYEIRSGGTTLRLTGHTRTVIDMLTKNTAYTFAVRALDASGNISTLSPSITVSTTTDRIVDHCDPGFDGLAGYWKFENDLTDGSPYSNTGALQGDPQFVTDSRHGKALLFDGTDDLVDLGACGQGLNEQYWNTTALSVMCWAKSSEPTWQEAVPGFVILNDGLMNRSWGLRPNNSPMAIRADQFYGENYKQNQIYQPMVGDIQEWHHYAATYGTRDGVSEYRVFQDGSGNQNGAWDHLRVLNDPQGAHLIFGRNAGASGYEFKGLLDEIRIYNKVLTQWEVRQLSWYSGNRPPVCSPLTITTPAETSVSVLLDASDADGQAITYAVRQKPQHGYFSGTAPDLTYHPDPGYAGLDSATYSVADKYAISEETLITINMNSRPAADYYWLMESGTDTWHTASHWNTSTDGSGSSEVPGPTDRAIVWEPGVCRVPSTPAAYVDHLDIFNPEKPMPELLIDSGALIVVNNFLRLGSDWGGGSAGSMNLKGRLQVVNANNNGVALGGYDHRHASASGFMTIDGGTFEADMQYLQIGPAGTGAVHVVNNGVFSNNGTTRIGSGATPTCRGSFQLDDGEWHTGGNIIIADTADGCGSATVNGGTTTVGTEVRLGRGHGRFTMNNGVMTVGDYERELIRVGRDNSCDAIFTQNGGTVTTFGLCANGDSDGTGHGTILLNGGLMDTVSTHSYWPNLDVRGADNRFILAGATFLGTHGTAHTVWLGAWPEGTPPTPNGTLEFRSGIFDMSNGTLYTQSNSLIRIIGPHADIDIGWWRHNSGSWPSYASSLELILTQDAGHITPLKGTRNIGQPFALPGNLRIGFQGGACLLATNEIPFYWCPTTFDHSYHNPEVKYKTDLWLVDEVSTTDPAGSQLNLVINPAVTCGTLNLASESGLNIPDQAIGYVKLNGINPLTAGELLLSVKINPGLKSPAELAMDLQAAGYTNSIVTAENTVIARLPTTFLQGATGYIAWDFHNETGDVLATVDGISLQTPNSVNTTILLIR